MEGWGDEDLDPNAVVEGDPRLAAPPSNAVAAAALVAKSPLERKLDEPPKAPAAPKRVAGAAVQLVVPRSWAERHDVAAAAATNVQRAVAAALGLCWPRLRKRLPAYGGDPLAYGGAVIDFLRNEGASMNDIVDVGIDAMKLCADGLFGEAEVKARADFSGAPGGGGT